MKPPVVQVRTPRTISEGMLRQMMRIEFASFGFPWSHDDWLAAFNTRYCCTTVCQVKGLREVIGFLTVSNKFDRLTMEVINFAVFPEYRNLGIGGRLFSHALKRWLMRYPDTYNVMAIIQKENEGAQRFFEHRGLAPKALFFKYFDNDGDALSMTYRVRRRPR